MVRKLSVLLGFLAVFSLSQGQTVRKKMNFDAGWKFHLGNASDPNRDFNYGIASNFQKAGETGNTAIAERFDETGWEAVSLPHDWVVGLPFQYVKNGDVDAHGYKPVGGLFPQNSVGWYRKHFKLDASDSGGRYILQFDGIYRDSKVWINGYYLGGNFSGYTPSYYDITDFIQFGKNNTLVVRADATQYEGWFYEGAGMYRHAWLYNLDNVHIKPEGGVYVYSSVADDEAKVYVESTILNKSLSNKSLFVHTVLTDRGGKIVAKSKPSSLQLSVDAENTVRQELSIKHPVLWDLDNPYLYRAIVVVSDGSRILDSVKVRFGVRYFRFDSKEGFFLNGKPLKIQGVCNHQDHAGVGSALPDYLQYYRVGLLKEMGVNAYRTSHNPPTPELLEACDSLGMLVMDETRLLTSGNEYSAQLKNLVLRDRNHPSVFMWSIGNEEYVAQYTNIGKRVAENQINLIRTLDTTRGITYAANMGNYFPGVNQVIPLRGFNYNLGGVDPYHEAHPNQPVFGTEVASTVSTRGIYVKDTVNCYVPDYDSTYPGWASTAETWWKLAADRKWFMGGFVWTGFDYRGEPTPYQWPNINSHFGVMDMCGFPKTVYYYYQAWWTDKDVLHIAPHWNWKGDEGKNKLVWINTNADNVELFLNGKSLGKKDMPRNGHLTWNVVYQPGVLEAIAYRNGKKIVSKVETTDEAYQVKLTPSKTLLHADGEDAVVVNVSVFDKQGHEVPDADNLVHFALDGADARIIGVGNGDPTSHEPDKCIPGGWQRHLFNGKAQLIIRAGNRQGSIHLKGTSGSLQPETININIQQ